MLPWAPLRWGSGEEEVQEERDPSTGSDWGETWSSGEEALEEPGTPPQDSPQLQSLSSSRTLRIQLPPGSPPGLASEQSPGTPAPLPPQMAWNVAPSRVTPLAPWDPNYEAEGGPQQWGASSGSGTSFSGRTLCHPSFWPLYEAAFSRGLRPLAPTTGHQNGDAVPPQHFPSPGFPVLSCEDVFLSDPLLPCGYRIPLYLAEAPQHVMSSLQLLLPPPIMSPWVVPTPSPGCSTALLSGSELIALAGLLQISQGEPRPNSSVALIPPADSPDLVSGDPDPSGDPSCSHFPDPSLPRTPDTHSP
ncbi:histone deacetylase complex subunit SAP25 [Trichechus manatus latirostris]|uniref:Histone deacetylase complex subunit SAP25 n=1 Tax=Trichechus manatus latirostris TaxID=127582 RepID=A0A2Y9RSW8_TRIMA|nr:histone deacetylase complex subunit SAP25 [Trichechus manatus latirostris]